MSSVFINLREEEYVSKVKIVLSKHLDVTLTDTPGLDIELFCSILQSTGSVVACGLILQTIVGQVITEKSLDIYTNFDGALSVNDFLRNNNIINSEQELFSPDSGKLSFYTKNNIDSILTYYITNSDDLEVRIIVLDNDTTPEKVVSNLPLTFLQILFDGVNLKSTASEQDIIDKKGSLMKEYIPLIREADYDDDDDDDDSGKIYIKNEIKKYERLKFTITIPPDTGESFDNPLNYEKLFVSKLYESLYNNLLPEDDEVVGIAHIYIHFLCLPEKTLHGFFNFLRKLASDWENNCILPFWIIDKYKAQEDIIILALTIVEAKLYTIMVDVEDNIQNPKYLRFCSYYQKYIKDVCEFMKITDKNLKDLYDKFDLVKQEYNEGKTEFTDKLNEEKRVIDIITYEKKRMIIANRKKFSKNRNIEWLNLVRPKSIENIMFEEKKINKCDYLAVAEYDINAYLKGEEILGTEIDDDTGKLEVLLEAVSPQEAMKRLVFFIASSSDDLSNLRAYCYNLDLIGDDAHDLFVECKGIGDMDDILNRFTTTVPVIRLIKLTGYAIYIPLDKFLYALYETKKQSFILIPTREKLGYNASMSTGFGNYNVSGDHCQEGSQKFLHDIKICPGDMEDLCWPVNIGLTLESVGDFEPNTLFLKHYFYVLENKQDELVSENLQTIAESAPMDREMSGGDEEQLDRDYRDMLAQRRGIGQNIVYGLPDTSESDESDESGEQ